MDRTDRKAVDTGMTKGQFQALKRRLMGTHKGRYDQREWRRIKQYRKTNTKEGNLAWGKVRRALKNGTLTKGPCAVCGDKNTHAHHHLGYEFPLMVEWLCQSCHQRTETGNRKSLDIIERSGNG